MSIRIHELAKKLSMDNKDLMALLKERGYPAKSVSSTVDNITAEALEVELAAKKPVVEPAPAPAAPVEAAATATPPPTIEPGKVKLPAGVFVKSAQVIQREKDEAAKAAAAARAAATATVTPPPAVVPASGVKPAPA